MTDFEKYLTKIKGNFRQAVKIEWLNTDESTNFEFTNLLYDINASVSVNYQNGSRRSCTIIINNNRNQCPVDPNNIWFGQKFKLWMGVYLDNETPYYFPQGVFYVSNPTDTYRPETRTVQINGVDKWAFLDGSLFGKLQGTYQTNINVNLYDATKELLRLSRFPAFNDISIDNNNISTYFNVTNSSNYFEWNNSKFTANNSNANSDAVTILKAKENMHIVFTYSYTTHSSDVFSLKVGNKTIKNISDGGLEDELKYSGVLKKGDEVYFKYHRGSSTSSNYKCSFWNLKIDMAYVPVDPIAPYISPVFSSGVGTRIYECPYTAKVERGKSYADVLLEYANIMCANIYYDVNGRLIIEPMTENADDITDTDKEVIWDYTVDEKTFLGLTQTYNFDKVYNDIIVLGNIVNGYQFKARVQNRNPMSNTCVQRIGLKTKEPLEDNQYYSDDQCKELAMYHAKVDTILQKSGNIDSTPLFHIDVNKLVSVSTPNNGMAKELFLITGYSLGSSGSMSLNITSVNILKDFSVMEESVNE